MAKTGTNFKSYLKDELQKRCRRNSSYSLRAFAKYLKVDDSFLSQVLRGRQLVSDLMLIKMGKRLALSDSSLEKFRKSLNRIRVQRRRQKQTRILHSKINKL